MEKGREVVSLDHTQSTRRRGLGTLWRGARSTLLRLISPRSKGRCTQNIRILTSEIQRSTSETMKCSITDCQNEAGLPGSARGLCRAHYRRWQRYGSEFEPLRRQPTWKGQVCTEPGCGQAIAAHGLCDNHYHIVRRRNDPAKQALRNKEFKVRVRAKQEAMMGRPRPIFCELCGSEGYGREPKIVFDHCHVTGAPRGWLCDRCNKVLGLVKDSEELLDKMAAYLRRHHARVRRAA